MNIWAINKDPSIKVFLIELVHRYGENSFSLREDPDQFNAVEVYLSEQSDIRDEDLIIAESMTQDFGFTGVLGKQTHSRLRNCFSGAAVESKDKSDSGIIEFSSLSAYIYTFAQPAGKYAIDLKYPFPEYNIIGENENLELEQLLSLCSIHFELP